MLAAARRRLGGASREALTAVGELAHILRHRGRIDADMLEMAKSAGEGLARVLGPDHLDTLISRNSLAEAYLAVGRTAEAIALHQATLKLRESKLGPDHPGTLNSRHNLAGAYLAAGRTAEATTLDEATLKLRESKLGPDHPDTLTSRNSLAVAYLARRPHRRGHRAAPGDAQADGVEARARPPRHAHQPQQPRRSLLASRSARSLHPPVRNRP